MSIYTSFMRLFFRKEIATLQHKISLKNNAYTRLIILLDGAYHPWVQQRHLQHVVIMKTSQVQAIMNHITEHREVRFMLHQFFIEYFACLHTCCILMARLFLKSLTHAISRNSRGPARPIVVGFGKVWLGMFQYSCFILGPYSCLQFVVF